MCFRMVDGCSSSCSVDLICRSSSSIRSLLLSLLLFVTRPCHRYSMILAQILKAKDVKNSWDFPYLLFNRFGACNNLCQYDTKTWRTFWECSANNQSMVRMYLQYLLMQQTCHSTNVLATTTAFAF